jgi:hypothetical protein
MTIDGSRLQMAGRSKPFGASRESLLDLKIDNLDLVSISNYAGNKLPIRLMQGCLVSGAPDAFCGGERAAQDRVSRNDRGGERGGGTMLLIRRWPK